MYPLSLSVLNDAACYDAMRHAAAKLLQGYYDRDNFRREIRSICNEKARAERSALGIKIKPAEITAQSREVADNALAHARDMLAFNYDGGRCLASIRRWWDKANGNSYFSVTVRIPQTNGGFTLFKIPFDYGYGSHPEWETVRALIDLGLFPRAEQHSPGNYPVDFDDQGYMQKGKL